MTIAQAFNEIAVAQGGTASTSGTIAGAIDALNDALAGSDQKAAQTIEDAVRLLGQNIGGGSSVTVESLTATENKTYTAPEGKAYSPVTVNVSGGGTEHSITCYAFDPQTHERVPVDGNICSTAIEGGEYISTDTKVQTAYVGAVLYAGTFTQDNVAYTPIAYGTESAIIGDFTDIAGYFAMPDGNCVVLYAENN